ncbi:uncharacterized protein B0H18DRAFT_1127142 [Fomitopsis serialis]|uniref:uncharacterized protein n=1 Tax=Fomitopsis serialis TaxID=139415 RepID=UPI002008D8BC|nr:uncharacterized protein B0H18DRAFT_1127142 [Neoantrodia serialis]KAH9912454.1 hypothetical protein B0H18DRAFT_1127142 [Neoantrodia serialis]
MGLNGEEQRRGVELGTSGGAHSVSSSGSDAYIHNRWLRGISFGSGNYEFHIPRASSRRRSRSCLPERLAATSACVLFWLGFMGPWCWLIGGWMLTTEGELEPEFRRDADAKGAILPQAARAKALRTLAPLTVWLSGAVAREGQRTHSGRESRWTQRVARTPPGELTSMFGIVASTGAARPARD